MYVIMAFLEPVPCSYGKGCVRQSSGRDDHSRRKAASLVIICRFSPRGVERVWSLSVQESLHNLYHDYVEEYAVIKHESRCVVLKQT